MRSDIERYWNSLDKRMDDELRQKLGQLMDRKNRLYEYTQEVSEELSKVDTKLRSNERVGLILSSDQLVQTFTKVRREERGLRERNRERAGVVEIEDFWASRPWRSRLAAPVLYSFCKQLTRTFNLNRC